MLKVQIKQPAETLKVKPTFATSAALVELVDVAVQPRGLVPGAPALAFQGVLDVSGLAIELSGGGDGERYLVTASVRDADDQVVESEIEVAVIEAGWALPAGGVPYLSIVDFVKMFGFDEVVRMTDGDGSGVIDRDLLVGALSAAQAEADSSIATRYAVPLTTVPQVIATAVADIARARLYPRGAPEGVADQAKAARRVLDQISAGQKQLGLPAADQPEAADEAPVEFFSNGPRHIPLCDL